MSASSPLEVSVILVTYNAWEHVRRCLERLPWLRWPGAWEAILVDNASQEPIPTLVREHFPWVRLLVNRENRGFAAAVNQALEVAEGRFLWLLNPDTKPAEDVPWRLVEALRADPQRGMAGAVLLNPDGTWQWTWGYVPWIGSMLLDVAHLRPLPSSASPPPPLEWMPSETLHGACLMARREMMEEIGGLDEGFFLYFEEADWCLRAWRAGWEVGVVPKAQVVHHGGASLPDDHQRLLHFYQSWLRLVRKHRGHWAWQGARWSLGGLTLAKWLLLTCWPEKKREKRAYFRLLLQRVWGA